MNYQPASNCKPLYRPNSDSDCYTTSQNQNAWRFPPKVNLYQICLGKDWLASPLATTCRLYKGYGTKSGVNRFFLGCAKHCTLWNVVGPIRMRNWPRNKLKWPVDDQISALSLADKYITNFSTWRYGRLGEAGREARTKSQESDARDSRRPPRLRCQNLLRDSVEVI